jgi:hypothetical protein
VSVYRQSARVARRTLVVGVAVALVAGLAGGFALGRSSAPERSLARELDDLRSTLRPVREGIELAPTEYGQAVKGGRVVAPTEYAAARADVQRARDALDVAGEDLRSLDPAGAASLDRAVGALAAAVAGKVAAAKVREQATGAARALDALLPASS